MKCDLVISYLNSNDEIWRKEYIDFCKRNNLMKKVIDMVGQRYSGIEWLPYQLKLINKHFKFINTIFVCISNIEQIKHLKLPSNVKIVLHKDFIPYQHLPTFNSTTIELFLPRIKELGEYFIYANDDMLPTKDIQLSNFFENGKCKVRWIKETTKEVSTLFQSQCHNSYIYVSKVLNKQVGSDYIKPIHSMTPMIKSHCLELLNPLYEKVKKYIRAFRNDYQVNQYVYTIYEHLKYGTIDSDIDFLYTELTSDSVVDLDHQIVCVNAEKDKQKTKEFISELEKICE